MENQHSSLDYYARAWSTSQKPCNRVK